MSGPFVLKDADQSPPFVLEHLIFDVELTGDDLIVVSTSHSIVATLHDIL